MWTSAVTSYRLPIRTGGVHEDPADRPVDVRGARWCKFRRDTVVGGCGRSVAIEGRSRLWSDPGDSELVHGPRE